MSPRGSWCTIGKTPLYPLPWIARKFKMQRFIQSGMSYEKRFRTRLGQQLSKIQRHDLVITPFPSVRVRVRDLRVLKKQTPRKASFYFFKPKNLVRLFIKKEVKHSPESKMIQLLTFDNLFPPPRHSHENTSVQNDDGYYVFLAHYVITEKISYS